MKDSRQSPTFHRILATFSIFRRLFISFEYHYCEHPLQWLWAQHANPWNSFRQIRSDIIFFSLPYSHVMTNLIAGWIGDVHNTVRVCERVCHPFNGNPEEPTSKPLDYLRNIWIDPRSWLVGWLVTLLYVLSYATTCRKTNRCKRFPMKGFK